MKCNRSINHNLSQVRFVQKIHRVPGFISNVETGRVVFALMT